jgi:hypothetical protein
VVDYFCRKRQLGSVDGGDSGSGSGKTASSKTGLEEVAEVAEVVMMVPAGGLPVSQKKRVL